MNKLEFFKCLENIFNEIKGNQETDYKDFKYVKNFIIDNPNDKDVKELKKWILVNYQKPFVNPELENALSLSDNLKFYKIQQIYKNLPFVFEDIKYPIYFYSIINSPSEYYGDLSAFYKACFWFFKTENACIIKDETIDQINKFTSENNILFKSRKDTYKSFEEELNIYKNLLLGKTDDEYQDFKEMEKLENDIYGINTYEGDILKSYEFKKLGNLGELFAFEHFKNFKNVIFTAKELGNGFGFDIYFQNDIENITYENLIEVKTTTNLENDDYFSLSKNEYNVMINTLKEENVNYYICRLFFNKENGKFSSYLLKLDDDNTLRSLNYENDNLEYELHKETEQHYTFKRKQKTLTY